MVAPFHFQTAITFTTQRETSACTLVPPWDQYGVLPSQFGCDATSPFMQTIGQLDLSALSPLLLAGISFTATIDAQLHLLFGAPLGSLESYKQALVAYIGVPRFPGDNPCRNPLNLRSNAAAPLRGGVAGTSFASSYSVVWSLDSTAFTRPTAPAQAYICAANGLRMRLVWSQFNMGFGTAVVSVAASPAALVTGTLCVAAFFAPALQPRTVLPSLAPLCARRPSQAAPFSFEEVVMQANPTFGICGSPSIPLIQLIIPVPPKVRLAVVTGNSFTARVSLYFVLEQALPPQYSILGFYPTFLNVTLYSGDVSAAYTMQVIAHSQGAIAHTVDFVIDQTYFIGSNSSFLPMTANIASLGNTDYPTKFCVVAAPAHPPVHPQPTARFYVAGPPPTLASVLEPVAVEATATCVDSRSSQCNVRLQCTSTLPRAHPCAGSSSWQAMSRCRAPTPGQSACPTITLVRHRWAT